MRGDETAQAGASVASCRTPLARVLAVSWVRGRVWVPAGAIGVTLSARVGEEVGEGVAVGDAGSVVLGVGLESRVEGEGRG